MKWLLLLLVVVGMLTFPAGAEGHASLLAPNSACPYQEAPWADGWRQKRAMICMTNFYRAKFDLAPLTMTESLMRSSQRKTWDVYRCGFSHNACGRGHTYWPIRYGYTRVCDGYWSLGENLAVSYDRYTVRVNFHALIHSRTHAHNMRRRFKHIGVGYLRTKNFNGDRAVLFTQHFGWRTCQ